MKHEKTVVIYYLDLFAYLVKHFLFIVIVCIIGMMISLGLHYYSENSPANTEKYNRSVNEYETTLNSLNTQRSNFVNRKTILETQKNEDPLVLMSDGRSITENAIILSIANNDKSSSVSDIDRTYYTITSTIKAFINTVDIAALINSSISNSYLNSVVDFSGSEGLYTIRVYTDNQIIPVSFAEHVEKDIVAFIDSREDMRLVDIVMKSSMYSGTRFIDAVEQYDNEIIELNSKIKEKTEEILSLEKSPVTRYHFVRYLAIGFLIGGFFSVLVLVISLILKNPIASSFKAERILEKPFLGSFFKDGGIFDVLSRAMIGERRFKNSDEEESYTRNSINNSFAMIPKKSKVAILSTSKEKLVHKPAEKLSSLLKESGYNTEFISGSADNPDILCVLKTADVVLILEKQWSSKWTLIEYNYNLSERFEKPVVGFVLC